MTYDITFEEGADTATVATGGGISSITGNPVYTTATFSEGAVAMLASNSTGTSCIRTVQVTDTTHTIAFDFMRASAISVDTRFVSWGNLANSTTTCNLKYKSATNFMAIANQSTTDVATTNVAQAANVWGRVEVQYNNTTSSAPVVTLRFYTNKDDAVANYASEISATLTSTTNVFERHNYGVIGGGSGTRAFYFDNIRKRPGLNWIGPVVTSVDKISSDTWAMVISEARTTDVFISRTDTSGLTVTDNTGGLTTSLSRPDSAALAVTEGTSGIVASLSRSDTAGLTVTESRALAASLQATDTAALSSAESTAMGIGITGTDTASISSVETPVIQAAVNRNDAAALTITESRSIIAFLTANDSGSMSVVESRTLTSFLTALDTGSIAISQSNGVSVEVARTDSFTISISEEGSIGSMQQLRVYWDGMWRTGVLRIYQDGQWYPVTIHFRKDNTWS